MPDPFGRALRDEHHGRRDAPLRRRDGGRVEHHLDDMSYFALPDGPGLRWLESHLRGPLLDLGAGTGRHALHFQERFETAAEVSTQLRALMRERGVERVREADLFAVAEAFAPDRFGAVLLNGTQAGLVGSVAGLRALFVDLGRVTRDGATMVLDSYDPGVATADLLGYRPDAADGLARRVFWFEYEGTASQVLAFRLFGPDRVRAAARATGWAIRDLRRAEDHGGRYYRVALRRQ